MANDQDVTSSSTEFIATPILFRSAFIGRPPLASRQEEVPVKEELIDKSPVIDNEVMEGNPKRTNESGESFGENNSNESRYKKNVSDESDSDESDSDESDSDENDVQVKGGATDVEPSVKPSRWRPTRFGSSFRLQAVRSPINNRRPN